MIFTNMVMEVTSVPLTAGAFYLDEQCRQINDVFMRCRNNSNNKDISECLTQLQMVLDCTANVFGSIGKSNCVTKWQSYCQCLDRNNLNYIYCRDEERLLDRCLVDEGVISKGKRLWKTNGPYSSMDPFKPANHRPEDGVWQYMWHVWKHKRYH